MRSWALFLRRNNYTNRLAITVPQSKPDLLSAKGNEINTSLTGKTEK